MTCARCRKATNIHTMSRFNTDEICPACEAEEQAHPDYAYAREVEGEAVRRGDLNFPGVGWPGKDGRVAR